MAFCAPERKCPWNEWRGLFLGEEASMKHFADGESMHDLRDDGYKADGFH